jgi:hypothetical protein
LIKLVPSIPKSRKMISYSESALASMCSNVAQSESRLVPLLADPQRFGIVGGPARAFVVREAREVWPG